MVKEIDFTTKQDDFLEITEKVKEVVRKSGMDEGTCIVYCPHTTASIVVASRMDPKGFDDICDEVKRLIPTRVDFKHQLDTPSDASGHVKSALLGVSVSFIISKGELIIGSSQGIFFMEFDGPRKRKVFIHVGGGIA